MREGKFIGYCPTCALMLSSIDACRDGKRTLYRCPRCDRVTVRKATLIERDGDLVPRTLVGVLLLVTSILYTLAAFTG